MLDRDHYAVPARSEAYLAGSPLVEPHHFLLAMMRVHPELSRAFQGIRDFGSVFPVRGKRAPFNEVQLSQESERVLASAEEEAQRLGSPHIEKEHLLIALLRQEDSPVAIFLRQHGFYAARIRESLYTASLLDNLPAERVRAARLLLRELRKRKSISLRITGPDLDRTFKFNPEPESPSAR